MKSHYLSFDLGASSGRAFVVSLENNQLYLDEIHRFSNNLILEDGLICWDFDNIIRNIKQSLQLAFSKYPTIISIGIDTWGVDYGLIDKNGKLLRNPVSYRDPRCEMVHDLFFEKIDKNELYKKTGIQYMGFNTIYQLAHDVNYYPELIAQTDKMLMIPDLIAYYLTGEKRIELTNLSTTNFYDPKKKEIISELQLLGIKQTIIPQIINPKEVYGMIKEELAAELKIPIVPVVAVCSHDTASAVLSIPIKEPHVYISSGTWSLCGTLLKHPITNLVANQENYTNEIGYDNRIRFLKNIMGLWIVNKCKEEWQQAGLSCNDQEVDAMILSTRPFVSYIDPDDPSFIQGENMVEKIQAYCRSTNQIIPVTPGEILRCIYQSLAFKYRYVIEKLEKIVNYQFNQIVIVGGGGQIDLLNQMVASLCNKKVIVGAKEATILGNALILMLQDKKIKSINSGKLLIGKMIGTKEFEPLSSDEYHQYYLHYCDLIERGV